jgi:hypothetical protein
MSTLPEIPGQRITHDHYEGEPCVERGTPVRVGEYWVETGCRYEPTLLTRLRLALHLGPAVCTCGHDAEVHQHWRRGSDCGTCGSWKCARFTRSKTA